MPNKKFNRGHSIVKPCRDEKLMDKLRSTCIKESAEHKYERLKDVPNEHPPFFGEPVRIIKGKEYGPKL